MNEDESAAIAGARQEPACGPDCQEALDELERFLDGELPDVARARIQQHLSDCYPCTDRATFEEQLRAIVRRGCADSAPTELVDRIRTGLRAGDLRGTDGS
ncbi:MAG: mycothiol system anti-sigma-R factor [Nitriliruptor sp.]